MINRKITFIEIFFHILFWTIPSFLFIKYNSFNINELLVGKYMHLPFIVNTLYNIAFVYSNIFLLFPAYRKRKLSRLQYIVLIVFLIVASIFVKISINNAFSMYYFQRLSTHVTFRWMFFSELLFISFFAIQSILYCIVKDWIKNERTRQRACKRKVNTRT